MSYRPDLHTTGHDQRDQGGYCNNLVLDDDGCGVVCGYRSPHEPRTPTKTVGAGGYEDHHGQWDRMIAQVRAEMVEYVAQIATDTLRMCQAGGVGEKNILPLQQEVGFQLCIDNIANLAKSMKGEGQ